MSAHDGSTESLYLCLSMIRCVWMTPNSQLIPIHFDILRLIPTESLRFPCYISHVTQQTTKTTKQKKVKAASSTTKVHYLLSLCLLWTLATIGRCDAGGLPQYVATHTGTSSLKEDWQLKPAGPTVPLSVAQSDEPQKTVSERPGKEWAGRDVLNPLSTLSGWSFHCG